MKSRSRRLSRWKEIFTDSEAREPPDAHWDTVADLERWLVQLGYLSDEEVKHELAERVRSIGALAERPAAVRGSTRLHWRSAFASMLPPPRDYDSIGDASHSAGVPIPGYAHASRQTKWSIQARPVREY
jgi:hypothetical protein